MVFVLDVSARIINCSEVVLRRQFTFSRERNFCVRHWSKTWGLEDGSLKEGYGSFLLNKKTYSFCAHQKEAGDNRGKGCFPNCCYMVRAAYVKTWNCCLLQIPWNPKYTTMLISGIKPSPSSGTSFSTFKEEQIRVLSSTIKIFFKNFHKDMLWILVWITLRKQF